MILQDKEGPILTPPPGSPIYADSWQMRHNYEKLAVDKWKAKITKDVEISKLFNDTAKAASSALILVNGGAVGILLNAVLRDYEGLSSAVGRMAGFQPNAVAIFALSAIFVWSSGVLWAAIAVFQALNAVRLETIDDDHWKAQNLSLWEKEKDKNLSSVQKSLIMSTASFLLGFAFIFAVTVIFLFKMDPYYRSRSPSSISPPSEVAPRVLP